MVFSATRLGEFFASRAIFIFVQLNDNETNSTNSRAIFKRIIYVIELDEKWCWLHFGRFFTKASGHPDGNLTSKGCGDSAGRSSAVTSSSRRPAT
jgi:hypothetical protein